jgi:hypothetical protein
MTRKGGLGRTKSELEVNTAFREKLLCEVVTFDSLVATPKGDWVVKGFIDIAKQIYTISVDTKVISKIMELLLFPKMCDFSRKNGLKLVLCKEQNAYPDVTFIDKQGRKFAVDVKSTYRKNAREVNGMTLGAFTGYFRNRDTKKNIVFPYAEYAAHFVLGVIYSRKSDSSHEMKIHKLEELPDIASVIGDFQFFLQDKYKIATDRPGSGNTKNIGSVTGTDMLITGSGPFAKLGEGVFDDYWMYYMTADMAKTVDLKEAPYRNLREYAEYKGIKK